MFRDIRDRKKYVKNRKYLPPPLDFRDFLGKTCALAGHCDDWGWLENEGMRAISESRYIRVSCVP